MVKNNNVSKKRIKLIMEDFGFNRADAIKYIKNIEQ